jgi:hypothetical protein
MPLTKAQVQELIGRNVALARCLGDLAIQAANVATALASKGAPAPEAFMRDLAEGGRLFSALRTEIFAAASSLDLPLPPLATVSSTSDLEAMLGALLTTVEGAEGEAATALNILDRVALLTHRDDRDFEPLRACQEQACKLRGAIEKTPELDVAATAPFIALLDLIHSHQHLNDEQWGALQDKVSGAFGPLLAMAAGRGRLVSASSSS